MVKCLFQLYVVWLCFGVMLGCLKIRREDGIYIEIIYLVCVFVA